MISTSRSKLIRSLALKKHRTENMMYVIEGDKLVTEYILAGADIQFIVADSTWLASADPEIMSKGVEICEVSSSVIKQLSTLSSSQGALAVVQFRNPEFNLKQIYTNLSLALSSVQDPGNMGTITRLAAWFGIENIICSKDCADKYNSKVVQASMGALLRVNIHYKDLQEFLSDSRKNGNRVFAASLEGRSVYDASLDSKGIILFGNESKGIEKKLMDLVTDPVTIPSQSLMGPGLDSLNVAISAAIICSEFRKRFPSL